MTTQWHNRITGYGEESPDTLLANPRNFRRHPKHQQDALAGVLRDVGVVQNVIVNRTTGLVVDGHARIALAIRDGQTTIPITYVELSEAEEALVLATLDPIAALATVDAAILENLLRDVTTGDAAVQAMLDALAVDAGIVPGLGEPGDGGDDFDTTPADGPTRVQRGELWQLGNHRLLCGDSTNAEDVVRLMDGERADMVLTDPPYGIERDKGFGGAVGFGGKGKAIARRVYADDWDSERPSQGTFDLIIKQAPIAIIFGGNFFADILPQGKHWLVWDKQNTMPTFGDCELAWTNIKRTSVKQYTIAYNGLIGREAKRFHPTQKPVALLVVVIEDYTDAAALTFDPFLGSGTTIIAAERTGRRCYGIEISEKYCDVIIRRWEAETGRSAEKVG